MGQKFRGFLSLVVLLEVCIKKDISSETKINIIMAASASLDDIDLAALKVSQTWKTIRCIVIHVRYRVYGILALLRIRDPVLF